MTVVGAAGSAEGESTVEPEPVVFRHSPRAKIWNWWAISTRSIGPTSETSTANSTAPPSATVPGGSRGRGSVRVGVTLRMVGSRATTSADDPSAAVAVSRTDQSPSSGARNVNVSPVPAPSKAVAKPGRKTSQSNVSGSPPRLSAPSAVRAISDPSAIGPSAGSGRPRMAAVTSGRASATVAVTVPRSYSRVTRPPNGALPNPASGSRTFRPTVKTPSSA